MPTIEANGIEISYLDEGSGPEVVVLVNGLADDLTTWSYQVTALLDAGYRVVRFDNRGIGLTSKPPGPYTTEMLSEDAKALADGLGLGRFHLLGVSMGGMIAQHYALAHPGDLQSLILACTYASPGPFCSRLFQFWADLATFVGLPAVMRDVTLWAFTPAFFADRPEEALEFDTAMRMISQPVPAYLAQLAAIQIHDTTKRLSEIRTPTLVLAGEQDILVPVSLSNALYQELPVAEWGLAPGGHACLWEHPGPFNDRVIEFLSRHQAR